MNEERVAFVFVHVFPRGFQWIHICDEPVVGIVNVNGKLLPLGIVRIAAEY